MMAKKGGAMAQGAGAMMALPAHQAMYAIHPAYYNQTATGPAGPPGSYPQAIFFYPTQAPQPPPQVQQV